MCPPLLFPKYKVPCFWHYLWFITFWNRFQYLGHLYLHPKICFWLSCKMTFFWPDPDLKNITYLRIKDSQTSVWRGLIYKATIKIDVLINIQMVDCLYFLEHVNIVHWYASLNLSSWEKKLLICLPRIINRLRELYHENFEWIAASSKFFVSRNIRTWLRISSKLAFTASKSIFGCPEEAV